MTDNPANNPAEVAGPTCPHCGVGIGEHEAELCLNKWVGETVTHVVPRRLWIATSDGGKSATMTSEYRQRVEKWVEEHPVVFGKPMWVAHWDIYPRYSSDISAAWEVVEEMRRKAPSDTWFCVWNAWETNRWVAGYMEYDMDGDITWTDESADALAAPLAICRAAVLAATGENT